MPVLSEREYRNMAPLMVQEHDQRRMESDFYVEGFATTFDTPYLLWEFANGDKVYEMIDRHALDEADMSDVIMQYDHQGRVFARQSNNTLLLEQQDKGLFIAADLGKTDRAKDLYHDIQAGMINKMSWAFIVEDECFDERTQTRKILKIKKVFDVSAVSFPANDATQISARSYAQGSLEAMQQERLQRRARIIQLKLKLQK